MRTMNLALRHELVGLGGVIERNIYLVKRYIWWDVAFFVWTVANTLTIVFIAKGIPAAGGQIDVNRVTTILLVGAVIWAYLGIIFEILTETVAWERWEGTIEYTFMAPVRRGTHMVGTALFSLVYGLLHTAIVLVVVVIVFDLDMSKADYPAATAVLVAGSLSLIGIGIMGAVLPLLYPERGAEMTHVIQAILVLISGVYIAADQMPEPLATISKFSPATYVIEGIRSALIDGKGFSDLWMTMVGLIISGVVLIPIGVYVFSMGERYAKRTGRLKRSG